MVFGFGERNYLMARSAGPVEMLSALFPSKSAILMTALRAPPTEAFADEQVRDASALAGAASTDWRT